MAGDSSDAAVTSKAGSATNRIERALNHGRRIKTILGQFRNKHARYLINSNFFFCLESYNLESSYVCKTVLTHIPKEMFGNGKENQISNKGYNRVAMWLHIRR
jgi:hypothetical protein